MSREKSKVKYGDGDLYIGHTDGSGLRHGEGSYFFADTCGRYEGEWYRDMMHGPGSFFFENGDVYAGMWCEDKKHGRGCSIHWHPHEGLFVYDGDFRLNLREGVAVYKIHGPKSVETNIGLFKENQLHQGYRVITEHASPAQVFLVVEGTETRCDDVSDVGIRLLPERRRQVLLQAFHEALRPMTLLQEDQLSHAIDLASFPLTAVTVSKYDVQMIANQGEFMKDIAQLSKTRHPALVSVFGCTPDLQVVSAQPPPSMTLFEALRMDQRVDVMAIGGDICRVLAFLHAKSIVFGSLCSLNVLVKVQDQSRAMLTRIDNRWWHCGWHTASSSRDARPPRVSLTLPQLLDQYGRCPVNWMAPELLQGRTQWPTAQADVYSFGLLVWEILAKRIPFDDLSMAQIVGYIGFGGGASRLQPSVAEVFRNLPEKLRVKASACLSGQPDARPAMVQLLPFFQREAAPEKPAWIKSMGDALGERTETMAKKFLAPSLLEGLSDMQLSVRSHAASSKQIESAREVVFVASGSQGKWVAVDRDLLIQYPDDVEKWQKFMSFRRCNT